MNIMIAVPCMDMMHTDFVISLTGLAHDGNASFIYSRSSLVYDSRNRLANMAIDGGFDRVLWLDSDMRFDRDILQRLSADLDRGLDMVCGLYVTRRLPVQTAIFSEIGYQTEGDKARPVAKNYVGYPKDQLFEIAACGFGGVLMNTSLLKDVRDRYGLPFSPVLGFGEDISFCLRVKELGKKMFCDSSVKLGHIGTHEYTEADL